MDKPNPPEGSALVLNQPSVEEHINADIQENLADVQQMPEPTGIDEEFQPEEVIPEV